MQYKYIYIYLYKQTYKNAMKTEYLKETLEEKITWINKNMQTVKWNEDLTLIENAQERKILEYKRIVQDCISTVECEGNTDNNVNELKYYVDRLLIELNR